jgi:hypothetical protein
LPIITTGAHKIEKKKKRRGKLAREREERSGTEIRGKRKERDGGKATTNAEVGSRDMVAEGKDGCE